MVRLVAIALLINLTSVASAAPTATDLELAKAHYKTGEIYYARGRFPDAAHEFEEAYRLSSRAEMLYNMGKSYDGAGDAAKALKAYRRFVEAVKESPDRPFSLKRLDELAPKVAKLHIGAGTVPGATVKLDGEALGAAPIDAELNPGAHTVEVTHEGYATFRATPQLSAGAEVTVEPELQSLVKVVEVRVPAKAERPLYKRWWLWVAVLGSAAVVGGVTAGVVLAERPSGGGNGVAGPFAQLPAVR